jgi:hypothetical protein
MSIGAFPGTSRHHLKSIIHVSEPTMTPTAVQTASRSGTTALNHAVASTPWAQTAATMPISAHNIQAGKNAPNKLNEGAPRYEQPTSVELEAIRRATRGSEGAVIV